MSRICSGVWSPFVRGSMLTFNYYIRVDGALDLWLTRLLEALLKLCPLSPGMEVIPADDLPPSRVLLGDASEYIFKKCDDPLETAHNYHTATVKCNRRITAKDWYQDVRHFEFEFVDDIQ